MKVLYICSDLGIPVLGQKGASVHVREMVGALCKRGHSVTVVAGALHASVWGEQEEIAGTLLHIPPDKHTQAASDKLAAFETTLGRESSLAKEARRMLYNQDLASKLSARFQHDKPDVIYERLSLYGTCGALLSERFGVPFILEVNAPISQEQFWYRSTQLPQLAQSTEQWVLKKADAVVVVSSTLSDYVVSLGVEPARVHVVPNGVNPTVFKPGTPDVTLHRRLGIGKGPVLGFIGGLRPWHGVEHLPHLLSRLVKKYPALALVIVGDSPLREAMEHDFAQRSLTNNVIFTGPLSHKEIPRVIRLFDIALAPYPKMTHEFYFSPLKLFEYMACGVALLAPEAGQIKEVIEHGNTGLLYPAGSMDELISSCRLLLKNPSLRKRLGRNAARHVRKHFTWDHNAERVTNIAHALIEQRSVSHGKERFAAFAPPLDNTRDRQDKLFDIERDQSMPTLSFALNPVHVQREFGSLPSLVGKDGFARLLAIRVVRYKPGRRCVVEYDMEVAYSSDTKVSRVTLIGKVRRGRYGKSGFERLSQFFHAGFGRSASDGILVPEPIAHIPSIRMWLQKKVEGRPASELLETYRAESLIKRIAEAAHKIHASRVAAKKEHSMNDEIRILSGYLGEVIKTHPAWKDRIEKLLHACGERAERTPPPRDLVGIHRDFYPEQVIVGNGKIYIVDFDLYCKGDPALDIGNFIGHIMEQSMRLHGDANALVALATGMEEHFLRISPQTHIKAIKTYTLLTLARHIWLSTLFADRRHLTEQLLCLCEERVARKMLL